jgi:predicted Zn-dependent protease with MMP-like domain
MWKMLIIAERTVSPEGIEDMTQELTLVIEDFDRAVQIQTLSLVKAQGIVAKEQGIAVKEQGVVVNEIGKHSLPRSGDTSVSMFHT